MNKKIRLVYLSHNGPVDLIVCREQAALRLSVLNEWSTAGLLNDGAMLADYAPERSALIASLAA